ncbi:MAG TPA: MATE family efflux transporter [Rhodopila sp.]|nr:MATE family efflux transporter [Rhodopila sp.]
MSDAAVIRQPAGAAARSRSNPRTQAFLHGPIVPTLIRLSWPNILVMLAQASTGLIETWWISRLGTDALAGMAVVFPVVMLMQMMSQGAMGGGISSAIARALGGGRQEQADALVLHAILINVVFGAFFMITVLAFGPSLYRALGGQGASLDAALRYSNVVFGGVVLLWVMNGLANVIRGTGNMLVPALVICGGVFVLVPLSPLLIFGIGPFPALGIAGGGAALVLYYVGGIAFFAWYILSGRNAARLRWVRPQWTLFREILRVGIVAAISSLQTNLTVAITTSLVGNWFGAADVAGYGTGARLEYLLSPLVYGIGGTLVAMVGMNIGAGQSARALRIAFLGGAAAFVMTEGIGLAAAVWPEAWLRLFDTDPAMLASGSAYLRAVGPFYGCYGLGFALYFASQGAGRLFWPLLAGLLRMVVATLGGWLALRLTGSQGWLFAALAAGLVLYGILIPVSLLRGAWTAGANPSPAAR